MPNRIEARSAKAALTHATGRLPLLRLFSTPLRNPPPGMARQRSWWNRPVFVSYFWESYHRDTLSAIPKRGLIK